MFLLFLGSLPHFSFQGVCVSLMFSGASQTEAGAGLGPGALAGQGHASRLAGKPQPALQGFALSSLGLHGAVPGSGATWGMSCGLLQAFSCIGGREADEVIQTAFQG